MGEFDGEQIDSSIGADNRLHRKERWKDAANTTLVEFEDRETAGRDLKEDDRANEVTGDNKEDVYTNESTRNCRDFYMECNHAQDCNGPEPVDIRTVGQLCITRQRFTHFVDLANN